MREGFLVWEQLEILGSFGCVDENCESEVSLNAIVLTAIAKKLRTWQTCRCLKMQIE